MQSGTIARLPLDKGFGFIRDERGTEHFFHRGSVRGVVFELLREGQRVEFSAEESQRRSRAGDVRLAENEPEHRGSGDSAGRIGRDGINATTTR